MKALVSFVGFCVVICNTFSSFKLYVIEPKGFLGYFTRGIACALNIHFHKKYPLIV
jgi:hypothetical protein